MNSANEILAETGAKRLPGDVAEIALRTGISESMVRKVINEGSRQNDKVLKAYRFLLTERVRGQKKFQGEQKGA